MTAYKILMADSVLTAVVSGAGMLPPGFRILGVASGHQGRGPCIWLVDVEDDDAPAELEGCLVEPTMQATYNDDGTVASTKLVDRTVLGWAPTP